MQLGPDYILLYKPTISEEARKAMLQRIRSEGMAEEDVAKLLAVFDKQGEANVVRYCNSIK